MVKSVYPSKRAKKYALEALELQGGVCIYCDEPLTPETMTIDHITPRSKGGQNTRGNIAACCRACNLAKSDMGAFTFQHVVRAPEDFQSPHVGRRIAITLANFRYRINRRVKNAEAAIRRAAA